MESLANRFNARYGRYLFREDIPYNHTSTLDVYLYETSKKANRKVIIFWYGGSWQIGDKSLYRFVADYLAEHTDAIVIVPNYQKYPAVTQPTFLTEAWDVIRWMKENISSYGGNPDDYSVVGHSSGGHTAAMIALGAGRPDDLNLPKRCVCLAAPNCFVGSSLHPIFGTLIGEKRAFPNDIVRPNAHTKFLLLQGRFDSVIYYRQQTTFLKTLRHNGIDATLHKTMTSHAGQIISLGAPLGRYTRSGSLVRKFLTRQE